jgi:hypothetical protein
LLSHNPETAKKVVLAEKPPIDSEQHSVAESLLDELIRNIGTLASVAHKSPTLLGSGSYVDTSALQDQSGDPEDQVDRNVLLETAQAMGTGNLIENLLDLDFGVSTTAPAEAIQTKTDTLVDLLSMDLEPAPNAVPVNYESFLTPESAQGLDLKGCFIKRYYSFFDYRNDSLCLDMVFTNKSQSPMSGFAIQFNVNS